MAVITALLVLLMDNRWILDGFERKRESYAWRLCVILQRGIVGRVPWDGFDIQWVAGCCLRAPLGAAFMRCLVDLCIQLL